jgi:nucleotide-binding universal stress UspA family protein
MTVLAGPAAALITQEAARTEADVIILGGHRGRTPGSTAERVVRTAHISCLIVPDHLELPLNSVLVPVDTTEAARGTLAVGLTWASALRRRGAANAAATAVQVLHVMQEDPHRDETKLASKLRAEVTEISTGLADVAGVAIEQGVAASRDVPGTILREAEKREADLIVLGTRAERIENDPLGSVSSAVVKSAATPILLVPPEVWRPDAEEFLVEEATATTRAARSACGFRDCNRRVDCGCAPGRDGRGSHARQHERECDPSQNCWLRRCNAE